MIKSFITITRPDGESLCQKRITKKKKYYFCPLCDSKVAEFVPLGGPLVQQYAALKPAPSKNASGKTINRFVMELFAQTKFSCPVCGGMDRERLVAAYLLRRLGRSFNKPGFRLLEFAPRAAVGYFLKKHFVLRHETADMYMSGVTYKVNLSCMSEIESETYNAWICLHVLEHVPNDRNALNIKARRFWHPPCPNKSLSSSDG